LTPRLRLLGVFVGIALLLPIVTASGSSADPLADKKAEAAQIQDQLDKQGQKVSVLAEQSNRAKIKVAEVDGSIAKAEADLASSDQRLQDVKGRLAQAAVLAYVDGGSTSFLGHLAQGGADDMIVRSQYLRITATDQRQVIGEVKAAKDDFASDKAQLESQRKVAAAAAADVEASSRAAAAAEDAQRVVLSKVTGELGDLVAADQARKEAEAAKTQPVFTPTPLLNPVGGVVAPLPAPAQAAASAPTTQAPVKAAPAQAAAPSTAAAPAEAAPAAPVASSSKAATAVAEAKKQLGKMYLYGGAGPDNFDCSGLTAWAWRAAGVNLNHSAYDQWFETTRVPVNAVQPGDLLFFGDNGVESIYHVAMYVGDGNMIEASTTGTPIRIRGWRSADLVGAGRPG
jgi:cell wall-associated NlpC family hydrolase